MKFIYKILVPTDLSDLSLSAMDYALSFSKIYSAQVYMMYVMDEPPVLAFPTVDLNSETVLRDEEHRATEDLHKFISEKLPNVKGIIPVVRRGNACKEIVKYAKDHYFDVVIMATHGHTGFAHILLGSTTEKVVRHSSVPVLTVKPETMRNEFVETEDVEEQLHIVG